MIAFRFGSNVILKKYDFYKNTNGEVYINAIYYGTDKLKKRQMATNIPIFNYAGNVSY